MKYKFYTGQLGMIGDIEFGHDGLFAYGLRQIKWHRDTIDVSNPRDLLGKYIFWPGLFNT